jgi:preprotein translocase subunit YajC
MWFAGTMQLFSAAVQFHIGNRGVAIFIFCCALIVFYFAMITPKRK